MTMRRSRRQPTVTSLFVCAGQSGMGLRRQHDSAEDLARVYLLVRQHGLV